MISAKILKDSINPSGDRLTTFELTYPRFIHAEFMTHGVIRKNASSTRAIPTTKLIDAVLKNPACPVYWGINQKGMQAAQELDTDDQERAMAIWFEARDVAVAQCRRLVELGVHKQIAGRILEPFMHITVIASATEWSNFFWQRTHHEAQPEMQELAIKAFEAFDASTPERVVYGGWHMPLLHEDDFIEVGKLEPDGEKRIQLLKKISVGRCARVSYLNHSGIRSIMDDIELHDRLLGLGSTSQDTVLHLSPFAHVARAESDSTKGSGGFEGWTQYRASISGESGRGNLWKVRQRLIGRKVR